MIVTPPKRNREDFSRIFDVAAGEGGFNAFLINKSMYLNTSNISTALVTYYTVKSNDTYTGISYTFYGTIDLWWLVCKMNDISNPFEVPNVGTILKILNKQYVQSVVMQQIDAAEKRNEKSTVNVN